MTFASVGRPMRPVPPISAVAAGRPLTHVWRRLRDRRIDSRVAPDAALVDGLLLGVVQRQVERRARDRSREILAAGTRRSRPAALDVPVSARSPHSCASPGPHASTSRRLTVENPWSEVTNTIRVVAHLGMRVEVVENLLQIPIGVLNGRLRRRAVDAGRQLFRLSPCACCV